MNKILLSLLILGFSSTLYGQKIVGYIPQYRTTEFMDAHVEWDKMTDAYYFGAKVGNTQGTLITIEEKSRLLHVRGKALSKGVNFWLSIGGWGKSQNFSQVAANATSRVNFANEMVKLCDLYSLTGVDLDWEFPSSSDKGNYKLLLKAISDAFDADGSGYLISVAAGAEQGHANNWDAGSFQYIDHFNIMSYDDPKLTDGNHSSYKFMKEAMEIYHNAGCPYEIMLGGVAFYGRCGGEPMYNEFANASSFDNITDIYNGKCYNAKQTCQKKLDYVYTTKGGLGVLIWEVTQDVKGQYSLLNALHDKALEIGCDIKVEFDNSAVSICGKTSVLLKPTVTFDSPSVTYKWEKNGSIIANANLNEYSATTQGTYKIIVSNNNCSTEQVVTVEGTLGDVDLGDDIHLCETSSVEVDANLTGGDIVWYKDNVVISDETSSVLDISYPGTYKVVNSASNCSSIEDQVEVTSDLITANDKMYCAGSDVTLDINEVSTGDIAWYETETIETSLYVGSSYTFLPSDTKTYFVSQGSALKASCQGIPEWEAKNYSSAPNGVIHNGHRYTFKYYANASMVPDPNEQWGPWAYVEECGGEGCARTSVTVTKDECLGEQEVIFNESFKVYPNPSQGNLFVEHTETIKELEVISSTGAVLISANQYDIDISSLERGAYILKITTSNGIDYAKVVKE